MTSVLGDIRDLGQLQTVFAEHKPEIVIHMAAQPLVRYSYQNPVDTYSTNVMGTVNVLEAVRTSPGVRAVVIITSDKCYENREWDWGYRENESIGGFDPYSNSKGCAELVTSAYRASYFNASEHNLDIISLATARAGNVIGGGDWSQDRLIPDIIDAFEQGRTLKIRNPNSIRPWQHVMEPLRGYLTLAEKMFENGPSFGEAWNFGPRDEDARTVAWIVEQMANLWGSSTKWDLDLGKHPHEAHYLKLDISKVRNRLNWNPSLRLNEALALTIDWHKQQKSGADMRRITLAQIENYQSSINIK